MILQIKFDSLFIKQKKICFQDNSKIRLKQMINRDKNIHLHQMRVCDTVMMSLHDRIVTVDQKILTSSSCPPLSIYIIITQQGNLI